jgi:ketosteroid isomerase-like protein
MDTHPNVDVVRRFLDSMTAFDVEAGSALLADDVVWYEIGRREPFRGKAALSERYLGAEKPEWEITGGETHDIVGNDEHVVALLTAHAKWGEKTLDYRVAEVYHVRDGKITARWAMSDDTEAINSFFKGT